jgi:uncharacterized protein YndB with AHSA1/START domain
LIDIALSICGARGGRQALRAHAAGCPSAAWAWLTETHKLTAWYGGDDSRIEPREGGAVWLLGGHVRGVVTQWKPGRRLAYSWNVFGQGEAESSYPESYLTIELDARGADTRLTLVHLPILERFEKQNAMGWHVFLEMVGAGLRGEPVHSRQSYVSRAAPLYGVDLENLQR